MGSRKATTKGFVLTGNLLKKSIRIVGESRGFAQSRLLTQWPEIAGLHIAAVARPVKVRYGRAGIGATLYLLTTGAHAPMLEMQKEPLRAKINAVYGYNAISQVRITQTAATGFYRGKVDILAAPAASAMLVATTADPVISKVARGVAGSVNDADLRYALETLGKNVLSRKK